jgi:hypothetical protein
MPMKLLNQPEWINKLVYPCNKYYSGEKGVTTNTYSNINGPQAHMPSEARFKKLLLNSLYLYDILGMSKLRG